MTRRMFFLLLSLSLAGIAWAQPTDGDDYMRLARLSYIEGPVSYQHATDVDWSAASINLPLEPGDRLYAGPDGRAEIEFDDGSVYRLAGNTDVEILSLREDLVQLRVLVGLSTLIVAGDTDFEINTPVAAFNTLREGVYRFNVEENGDSDAIVRKGKLEAANNKFSRRIESGEMLHIAFGNNDNPEFARYERRDEWDEWNDRRNADLNAYSGRKYLPDTVYIGASDLYRDGRWVEVESYGSAWIPYSIDAYWSPYSVGRWCYRPLYGWTWVSYEPWGWLPYHYGRWYRSSVYGWCWLPGPAFTFNFWSPGLVAFYSGPGWISWCPLGPGDYYDAHHYHFRGIYRNQLNELSAMQRRGPGNYLLRDAPNAFRTAPIDRFRNGSFGERNREGQWTNIDQPWKRGELVADPLSIRPTAASYRAIPDRQAVQPARSRQLPAVVRSNPAFDSRGQDHFTRITNPQIPALPSRAERNLNAPEGTTPGRSARTNSRANQTPQREPVNAGAQNPPANSPAAQSGRRMTTYRWSGTTGDNRENSNAGENSAPATQQEATAPSGRQSNTPRGRSEQVAPERNQTPRTPSEAGRGSAPATRPGTSAPATRPGTPSRNSEQAAPERTQSPRTPAESKPNTEERKPSRNTEPRSDTNQRWNSDSQPVATLPQANSARSYSTFRQSTPPVEQDNSGIRSFSTPFYGRSGGNSSPSFGKSSGGGTSSSFSGESPKAQERGSSGGGRGRR